VEEQHSSLLDSLAQCEALLAEDKEEEARTLFLSLNTKGIEEVDLHLSAADTAEKLGITERIVYELNQAYRCRPDDLSIIRRIAVVRIDAGQYDRAEKCLRELISKDPQDLEAYRNLGNILEEGKQYGAAAELYREAYKKTNIEEFLKRASSVENYEAPPDNDRDPVEEKADSHVPPLPEDNDAMLYLTLFQGREGTYARQWVSPTGESGYTPVREPFTLNTAKNHLIGNITVGLYQLRIDNTLLFIAFDIDIPKSMLSQVVSDKRKWDSAVAMVHKTACAIADTCASLEIPAYIEDSGHKGRHVWIFLDEPVQAKTAKNLARFILSKTTGIPPQIHVEVFPKQTFVKEDGLGNLIKIPLGIHKKSGRRSLFLDPEGKPFPRQLSFLKTIRKYSRDILFETLASRRDESLPKADGEEMDSAPFDLDDGKGAQQERKQAMKQLHLSRPVEEYNPERDHQFQVLLVRCPVIRHLVEKARQFRELNNDEAMVLVHSLGHLDNGPEAVNAILRECPDANESLFLKSRLRGNPVSCPKIRSRIPEVTSKLQCNCQFDPRLSVYPNPLIHLQGPDPGALGVTLDSLQFHSLVQDYLKTRKILKETEILMERYQERMNSLFEEAGVQEVETPLGRITRAKNEDGTVSFSIGV
jgi:tetratricopeptide (TPR) repeat protein